MKESDIIEVIRAELSRQQAALTRDPPYVNHADPARTIMSGTFDLEAVARSLSFAVTDFIRTQRSTQAGA